MQMNVIAIGAAILASLSCCRAQPFTLEDISPRFRTNTSILWRAPLDHLPKSFVIYRQRIPKLFSQTLVSNATALAALPSKGFPRPSTKQVCLDYDTCPCGHPCTFLIDPSSATLAFSHPDHLRGSSEAIPDDEMVINRAWESASRLGLDSTQLFQGPIYSSFCEYDLKGQLARDKICARGISLSRRIDGIPFLNTSGSGWEGEGLGIEFGSRGQIRSFALVWPDLESFKTNQTARPEQIIECIRSSKTPLVPPIKEEFKYFDRIKNLSNAQKLTLTKITPYYGAGRFGEMPTNNAPPQLVVPIAHLDAVAEFSGSNITVRFYAPIISSEVARLLGDKAK